MASFEIKKGGVVSLLCPAGEVYDTAVAELSRYLSALCGAVTEPTSASVPDGLPVIVLREDPSLGEDAFRLAVEGGRLYLSGGNGRGVLYAVYGLLTYLGCRFYAEDTEVVPPLDGVCLPEGFVHTESSPFEMRDPYWIGTFDPAFCVKQHINAGGAVPGHHRRALPSAYGAGIGYAGPRFVHTFEMLVPADRYFDEHPEYFSMIDGERTGKHLYSQLCLSNPDVLRLVVDGVRRWLKEAPGSRLVSVSQNDSFVIGSYCTCPACKKIDEEEGSPAGSLIRFVNAVAETLEPEFPDVAFDTLAYQYSTVPPRITKPRHNVIIRMCTGGCSSHAIDACPNNAGSRACIERWAEICNRLYIWDYTTDFLQYLNPFPNFQTLQPNIRFFLKNHVKGVFEQGNYNAGKSGEFGELRVFLLSSLLWNPDFDVEKGTADFLAAYYGDGAPYVRAYLDFITDKVRDVHFNLVISAANLWNQLVSDEELEMLDQLWVKASDAALHGQAMPGGISPALCAEHVERSALCHRWFKLDAKRGEFADPDRFDALADRFYKDCNRLGVTNLSEGANVPWVEVK